MKERALDLRDVALRVIRNLDAEAAQQDAQDGGGEAYVLGAQKLSIPDMFHLDHARVLGIIAEAGGVNSHAAILARSMRIPTVCGVGPLRERLRDGDFVIVDAGTGVVHVNPDERVRREYAAKAGEARVETPFDQAGPAELGDGARVFLLGSCGNLGEVSQSIEAGLDGIGVYRTELLFLIDRSAPGEDLLLRHYGEVLERAGDKPVSFRLLDLTRDQHVAGLRAQAEPNPVLGLKGVRLLLHETSLLRLQVRALLRLVPGGSVRVAVPFVTSAQDLSRVKEVIRAERAALLKAEVPCADRVELGAVVEVPAVAFHLTGVASEADFLVVALDGLQQYLLAADRDNAAVGDYHRTFHPALFHALNDLHRQASAAGVEVTLFGEAAADPLRLPFYVGVGYKRLSVSPVRAPHVRAALSAWTEAAARDLAARVLAAEASLEVQRVLLESER
jgi:phosphoenolpyruvate-protein kinase (PTS system EI component)